MPTCTETALMFTTVSVGTSDFSANLRCMLAAALLTFAAVSSFDLLNVMVASQVRLLGLLLSDLSFSK